MRADRCMPVFWMPRGGRSPWRARPAAGSTPSRTSATRRPGRSTSPRPPLFVVGGERHGIPAGVLSAADRVLRLPMRGFIPSYNLQAAMAGVALERLRQLCTGPEAREARR